MRKWRDIYWNDFKSCVRDYGVVIILVLLLNTLCFLNYRNNSKNQEYIKVLEESNKLYVAEQLELLETTTLMGEEIDRLVYENGVFTSMLAALENEPGGHEMLKKLYDQER